MRYVITSQQLTVFRRDNHISFENFLGEEEALRLLALLEEGKREKGSGRDLERGRPLLKKAIPFSRLGQMAAQLFGKKRLRCGYTQFPPEFPKETTLEEISPVTEVLGGAILQLGQKTQPPSVGDVTFYTKDFLFAFPQMKGAPIFLIVFTGETTRYRFSEQDPQAHALKTLGYGFGDSLSDETHPFIAK